MGRPRKYGSDAERQAAFRARRGSGGVVELAAVPVPVLSAAAGLPVRKTRAHPRNKPITEADKERFLENVRSGMTIRSAAEAAAHPPDSFRSLQKRDLEFRERYLEAKEIGTDTLEDEAIKRARDGIIKPVWGKVQPGIDGQIGSEVVYSDKLLEVMLKARRPEYRDSQRIDVTNQTLNVTVEDRSAALSEVAQILVAAGVNVGEIIEGDAVEVVDGGGGVGEVVSGAQRVLAESSDV